MYTIIDFKSKKAFKEAVAKGVKVRMYQPGGIFNPPENSPTYSGPATIEGPHYPKPHTWYASVMVREGIVVGVK